MPGQAINLSQGQHTVIAPGTVKYQPGNEALDLLGFSGTRFDFCLRGIYIAGTSPTATVSLYTSMYPNDNTANWDLVWDFTAITAPNAMEVKSISATMLRYLRWSVSPSANTTSFTFELLGMAW
jgi:hypothetical protein